MKNFLYQKIEIDNILEISEQLQAWDLKFNQEFPNHFKLINTREVLRQLPLLSLWFKSHDTIPTETLYIKTAPLTIQGIHVDPVSRRGNSLSALNFPISKNCRNTFTRFYQDTGSYIDWVDSATGNIFPLLDDEDPKIIGEYKLSGPTLLNIRVPHAVYNPTLEPRVTLSFRFKNEPWHLLINHNNPPDDYDTTTD
jgi:hypothetical protein